MKQYSDEHEEFDGEADAEARRHHKEFDGVYKENRCGAYAHFPLLLLGLQEWDEDKSHLIDTLIIYSICYNAAIYLKSGNTNLPMTNKPPDGFNEKNRNHRAVASAMARLGASGGNMDRIKEARSTCRDFLEPFSDEGQPLVRIPMTMMFDFQDREDIRELDFRILCAVNSCIGKNKFAIIRADQIALRAAGAKDRKTLVRLGVSTPTERQVRFALEKLQAMGYFRRVLVSNRWTFICRSRTMTEEELIATAHEWRKAHRERKKSGQAIRL